MPAAVAVPEHIVTMEETLELAQRLHADHPQLPLALRLIQNTGVATRHLVAAGVKGAAAPRLRSQKRAAHRVRQSPCAPVVRTALHNADLTAQDIDLLIYVSCTGFAMPSMTAWLINTMGFRPDTRQLPIAQLGCAAGGAAINRAHDFCTAYPYANALIVACEFCSLQYQPTDDGIGTLLSNGLFGDAVAAAVVRGSGGAGVQLQRNASYLVPDTEDWICLRSRTPAFTSSWIPGSRPRWRWWPRRCATWSPPNGGTPHGSTSPWCTPGARASWTISRSI